MDTISSTQFSHSPKSDLNRHYTSLLSFSRKSLTDKNRCDLTLCQPMMLLWGSSLEFDATDATLLMILWWSSPSTSRLSEDISPKILPWGCSIACSSGCVSIWLGIFYRTAFANLECFIYIFGNAPTKNMQRKCMYGDFVIWTFWIWMDGWMNIFVVDDDDDDMMIYENLVNFFCSRWWWWWWWWYDDIYMKTWSIFFVVDDDDDDIWWYIKTWSIFL
jgi:hypothetical protein